MAQTSPFLCPCACSHICDILLSVQILIPLNVSAINWERSAFFVVCSAVFLVFFFLNVLQNVNCCLKEIEIFFVLWITVIQYEIIAWVTCLVKTEVHVLGKCYFVFLYVVLFKLNFLTAGLRWLVAWFFFIYIWLKTCFSSIPSYSSLFFNISKQVILNEIVYSTMNNIFSTSIHPHIHLS